MYLIRLSSFSLLFVLMQIVTGGQFCSRYPTNTFSPKSPVDENFAISITGNAQTYILDQEYNVTLNAFNGLRFISFGLTLETENGGPGHADNLGRFEIIDSVTTRYSPNCVNMVENTSTNSKATVTVVWRAPSEPGSGCILIRAMVLQHRDVWYMDDGGLTRRICEEVVDDMQSQKTWMPHARCCACDEARYEVIFEGVWSRNLHPKNFPIKSWTTRFSDIVGSAHSANYRFWEYGTLASDGMREFGEHGSTRLLEQEFSDNFKSGKIRTIIKARGPAFPNLNGKSIASVRVDPAHSLLSLASKIEPSPDWIVGISGLELCMPNCTWLDHKVITLYPWDLGTDAGPSYISADQPQVPPDVIRRLRPDYPNDPRSPFFDVTRAPMKPLALLTIRKQRLYERPCSDYESNNVNILRECHTHPWTQWTECSAQCGEGRRTRTRVYKQPQLAKINNCDSFISRKQDSPCVGKKCDNPDQQMYNRLEAQSTANTRPNQDLAWSHDSFEDRPTHNTECELDEWGPWKSCNQTCGEGNIMRLRYYKNPSMERKCQMRMPYVNLVEYRSCISRDCLERHLEPESQDLRANHNRETNNKHRKNANNFFQESKNERTQDGEDFIEKSNDETFGLKENGRQYNNDYEPMNNNEHQDAFENGNLNTINREVHYDYTEQSEKPHKSRSYYESSVGYNKNARKSSTNVNFYKTPQTARWFSGEPKNAVRDFCFQPLNLYHCTIKTKTANYWFYNYCSKECMIFAADSCDRNENKFNSLETCRRICDQAEKERHLQPPQTDNCQVLAT